MNKELTDVDKYNIRLQALSMANDLRRIGKAAQPGNVKELLQDAKRIEAYLKGEEETLQ